MLLRGSRESPSRVDDRHRGGWIFDDPGREIREGLPVVMMRSLTVERRPANGAVFKASRPMVFGGGPYPGSNCACANLVLASGSTGSVTRR